MVADSPSPNDWEYVVSRLRVRDRLFRTRTGLGVGSMLGEGMSRPLLKFGGGSVESLRDVGG